MITPQIHGHRGCPADAPENTLASFRRALEQSADAVEFDVRLTADGVPVVLHDATVNRTTDGEGPVESFTLEELKRLDAGAWKAPQFAGERIPTLDEALDCLAGCGLNIEIKPTETNASELVALVVSALDQRGVTNATVASFDAGAIAEMRRRYPHRRTALIFSRILPPLPEAESAGPLYAIHAHHTLITPRWMEWARARNYKVNAWTVNDAPTFQRLAALGVDAITTDTPGAMRQALESTRA